ncbi:MAG: hypothetical protein IH609_18785 [Dehalococcoidia bacterium]|nr:hypothetical protein [Dehalococcoidia bacterium]
MRKTAVIAVAAAVSIASVAIALAGGHRSQSDVYWFSDGSMVDGASAQLVRGPNGVSMRVTTTGLEAGSAYTVWWVVFNHPEFCENGSEGLTTCGEGDLFIEDVEASVLYAAGNVVGASGQASFADGLKVGDLSGCQEPFAGFGICRDGLTDPLGAEIHLVIRSHDEVVPPMMPAMIHTFIGACDFESSLGANDGPNVCEDQQFAAFVP